MSYEDFPYGDRIGHTGPQDEYSSVFGIALVKRCREEIRSLSESFECDNKPFTPEMVDRERARRDEIRDRISQLPTSLQVEEQDKEQHRIGRWDDLWRQHRESGQLSAHHPPVGSAGTVGGQGVTRSQIRNNQATRIPS
ncbi:hypothetical protein F4809DRAFT_644214 [Biscogniauxia mediterranea]|nr:hypothetical protein F4809DRAFT_644214 [Biscogniauxia mediterranea]